MARKIQQYLDSAAKRGITDTKSKEAVNWFRSNIRKTAITPKRIKQEEQANMVNSWTQVEPGGMYLVHYDPKHKKTLPYYDIFPLIVPVERYDDGILGLNLHYLPPILRASLLDALMDSDLETSYKIMQSASRYKHFQPCIKRYLGNHFRGRFVKIEEEAWAVATFLPVEQFEKASKQKVWSDSRKKVK